MGKIKDEFKDSIFGVLGCCFPFALLCFIVTAKKYYDVLYSTHIKTDILKIFIISGFIVIVSVFLFIYLSFTQKTKDIKENYAKETETLKREYDTKKNNLEKQYQNKNKELIDNFNSQTIKLQNEYKAKSDELLRQRGRMNVLLVAKAPFRYSATLAADMKSYVYEDMASYLKYKSHPAISASEAVKAMKAETKNYIAQYKDMLYKYEFLLKTFPELKKYVDDEEALQSLDKVNSYTELTENTDHAKDFLSDEEWKKLNIDERNQLALDRYNKRPKSNWKIGIEYEMYVDFILRTKYHFSTIPYGSLKGLEDLGRDIIATRIDASGTISTYIIQCKYWSSTKIIHENVVCQTFGTAMEYQIKQNLFKEKVIPVIATTTILSDIAQKFAKKLGVVVWKIPKGEYPMIKCNINNSNGEKIYHLPFDQQYYRTEIKRPGEFYAWTVKEATSNGFRRALKHIINNNI